MPRKINRLLIANRGEIAQRIIQSARELSLETHAIYTPDDAPHARLAHHAILLGDPSAYTDTAALVRLCAERGIDAIHPGYGFLSESAEFAELAARAGVLVVGPGPEILRATGDKVAARRLAQRCGVPVLPALESPARSVEDARRFAAEAGYPVMIKAVDGGGGRGIRLAESEGGMDAAFRRAVEESPTRRVFVERAAVRGFKHVEVQVVGDGRGRAVHLFERECSVQRRWQKVVEVAPCVRVERRFIRKIVDAALRIATEVSGVIGFEDDAHGRSNTYRLGRSSSWPTHRPKSFTSSRSTRDCRWSTPSPRASATWI
jgi:pyruvate carboxylase